MANSKTGPIVLLTDFGLSDAFVGILKGVITTILPQARVIDLTHGIPPQDILQASLTLYSSVSYFPKGSIFCVVVDPGVGSDRTALCLKTKDYVLIGPDNGVLWQAAIANGIEKMIKLNRKEFFLDPVSKTFHGRDIFAPVAAHLATGNYKIDELGDPIQGCKTLNIPGPEITDKGLLFQVLYIDHFGNVGLSLTKAEFDQYTLNQSFELTILDHKIDRAFQTYSHADDKQPFLIGASNGFMEVSLQNGNAAEYLSIQVGDSATLQSQPKQ